MTWFRCSGGSGEVHGATIVAITNRQDCVGRAATLSFDDEVVQTKSIASDLSILFDPVQTDGTYTIDTTNAEGDSVHATVTVSARDVLDAETKTVSIDMNVQLVHYTMLLDTTSGLLDECVDLTGGWGLDGYSRTGYNYILPTLSDNGAAFPKVISGTKYLIGTNNAIDSSEYASMVYNLTIFSKDSSWGTSGQYWLDDSKAFNNSKWGTQFNNFEISNLGRSLCIKSIECNPVYPAVVADLAGTQITLNNMCMVKADDWDAFAEAIGYTHSMDDFFNSTDAVTGVLSSAEAVNYMLKKMTGDFMAKAVTSQNFLTALNSSSYRSVILSNQHWSKFLSMVGVTE